MADQAAQDGPEPAATPAARVRPAGRALALLRHPWGSVMLRDPLLCRILALAPLAILPLFLVAGWRCPLHSLTGIPCPGCGMTRALAALLHGDLAAALALHPFAPAAAAAWLALALGAALPEARRQRLADAVARLERRLALSGLVLAGFVLYGLARMLAAAFGIPCAACFAPGASGRGICRGAGYIRGLRSAPATATQREGAESCPG